MKIALYSDLHREITAIESRLGEPPELDVDVVILAGDIGSHHHDSLNFRIHDERLGFAAHGVGFMGITDMFGGLIRIGCFDEERAYRNGKTRAYE